ncbi:ABC transporter ATP-binding protein [Ruania zhangjianzhongii]|uniref:ABC transporter ATP-binding protein n=1 Tax=Ruania zhangjianzhongii TaxID=2603206 RepID=UPI0011C77B8B|nr:ABC transporter ATP-binding protein [Ruania zhangjianzhongii]
MTTDTMLQATDLTKEYLSTDPPTQVINGVDLQVRTGEFLAVMGASGSGKSTLLYTISGMDRPTGGRVHLGGQDLTALGEADASRLRLTMMGFVFQQAYFLRNLSIRDNILLPALKATPGQKKQVLARVDALMERFGLARLAARAITEVSGGQLQRASICRALVCEPEIVFADEPTGSLNSQMTGEVMDALTEVHTDGRTLVMVTHDPACAARADRVVYLRDGQLVDSRELGTWTEADADRRTGELLDWLRPLGF